MSHELRICVDRRPTPSVLKKRLALTNASMWEQGETVRVAFLEGDPTLQKRVEEVARRWTQYSSVKFLFGAPPDKAQIRITFRQGLGSWSQVGRDCMLVTNKQEPTMNYGWLTPASTDLEIQSVVLHEFGHALGCIHEHQSPAAKIQWNKEAVYKAYGGWPNYWSQEEVDQNVFGTYDRDLTSFSEFDPKSIMLYPIPKDLTTDGFEVGFNQDLSSTDIAFIRKVYGQ